MTPDVRCSRIRVMLSDVDGVLTDGRITYDNNGVESKTFHVRDGMGIRLWQRAGYSFGIVTARSSQIVRNRAAELDVSIVRQGVGNKRDVVEQILQEEGFELDEICYIGDDLPDIGVLRDVGLGIAVADACEEARDAAHWITNRPGGNGAVREAVEFILKQQGRWDTSLEPYGRIH